MDCVGFITSVGPFSVWHFRSVSVGSFEHGMGMRGLGDLFGQGVRGFQIVVAYTFCLITR